MLEISKNEEKVIEYWKSRQILEKTRAKNRGGKPFYFLDGPPFVSGDLHPAQIWTKSIKDASIRYRRYRGYDVIDRAGYDVHGLPVENNLEKELGIQSKKEIEQKIGLEKFINSCREYVEKYIGRMDADYERFGISLDFKNPYLPYKNEYIETAWQMFKKASEKGFLYAGKRTLIYCPHCETPLSQGSMEVEYKETEDPSVYVSFKVNMNKSRPGIELPRESYLLIWTTTPWTLPANVAIAVNPEKQYLLINSEGKNLIIAKERLDDFSAATGKSATVLMEFKGIMLKNTYYTSPLAEKVPTQKKLEKYHKVIFSESLVSMGEGTGLVHIAPGNGIEDFSLGKINKLPIFSPINPDATYSDEAGEYRGIKVPTDGNKAVIRDLEQSGNLAGKKSIRHSYPYCWRCSSKLIFLATDQWFINIKKMKKKMIKQNEKVNWHPPEVKEWQKAVLENSPDWCISRQRYWGAPMPIWKCQKCERNTIIGSLEELRQKAANPSELEMLKDLHRPYIDKIKLICECGGTSERIKDIFDVWFDSGITFRASMSEEQFEKFFPADLIVEYIEQIRAWFQYLMKCGLMTYGRIPFENVIVHGIMSGTDGRKMSKSFGNYRPLGEITKIFGADAFRLWSINHPPILNRNLNENEIRESQKTVIMLYNISSLLDEYQASMGYVPKPGKKPSVRNMDQIDRWMLSRTETLIKECTKYLDEFETYKAADLMNRFIVEDFSRFYLKSAKKRMNSYSRQKAKTVVDTVSYVLHSILIPVSVIMPFLSEHIYIERYKEKESIFLERWPSYSKKLIDEGLESEMSLAQEVVTAMLNAREKIGIRLRQPLAEGTIEVSDNKIAESLERLAYIIEDYVNLRKVLIKIGNSSNNEIQPQFKSIGPDFKENAGIIAEALKSANAEEIIKAVKASGSYEIKTSRGNFAISERHFTVVKKLPAEDAIAFSHGIVYLDPTIDEELKNEAAIRTFERKIQTERKSMQLRKSEKIIIRMKIPGELSGIIKKNLKRIMSDLNALEIKESEDLPSMKESEIEGEKIYLAITKNE